MTQFVKHRINFDAIRTGLHNPGKQVAFIRPWKNFAVFPENIQSVA